MDLENAAVRSGNADAGLVNAEAGAVNTEVDSGNAAMQAGRRNGAVLNPEEAFLRAGVDILRAEVLYIFG